MTYDSSSPPTRVFDIVSRTPDPGPEPAPPHDRPVDVHLLLLGCPPYVHPWALLGWPARAGGADGPRRPPRRRGLLRRRPEGAR